MFTNVLQKPFGAVAVLAAAIGGPYAAFETETGSSLRKSILGGNGSQQQPSTNDPFSLSLLQNPTSGPNAPGFGSPQGLGSPQAQMGGWPSQYPSPTTASPQYTSMGTPANNGYAVPSTVANQPAIVYGQATMTPLNSSGQPIGQPMPYTGGYSGAGYAPNLDSQNGYPSANNIETRQGPAQAIPGGTHQLWDYTLGVPSLQQMQRQPTQIGGGEVYDLREVLRFDITPVWLTQRFSRVTTVLSNVQLDGMRVPLITGIQPTDLAGTLTYYFDGRQSLRRVNLHGLTGDPTKIAALMVQNYGFQQEQTLGGQLFTTRWNNRISSLLHLAPAPIIYAGADHSKFVVFLELNQADSSFGLSPEAADILRNLQSSRRW